MKIHNIKKTDLRELWKCFCLLLEGMFDWMKILFLLFIIVAFGFVVIYCAIGFCRACAKDIEEESKERQQRQIEINESFQKRYAGKEFYKFNLDGHDYWYIDSGSRGGGLCHSETCPCKTNAVETAR